MTAQELQTAATRLRDTAKNVDHAPPWAQDEGCPCCVVSADIRPYGAPTVANKLDDGDAAWIALAHPGLAEPLATWLEFEAGLIEDATTSHTPAGIIAYRFKAALAVANVINGTEPS